VQDITENNTIVEFIERVGGPLRLEYSVDLGECAVSGDFGEGGRGGKRRG
jgi:hypothetical protein